MPEVKIARYMSEQVHFFGVEYLRVQQAIRDEIQQEKT